MNIIRVDHVYINKFTAFTGIHFSSHKNHRSLPDTKPPQNYT